MLRSICFKMWNSIINDNVYGGNTFSITSGPFTKVPMVSPSLQLCSNLLSLFSFKGASMFEKMFEVCKEHYVSNLACWVGALKFSKHSTSIFSWCLLGPLSFLRSGY